MKKNTLLENYRKIYFVGIKGVALSGLAVMCREKGHEVTGSDTEKEFITDKILQEKEIPFFSGFRTKNLEWGPDMVVVGASWDESHEEVREARKKKIPIITESELRGIICGEKTTIAVTGVHGKSTTTALLSYIFSLAGLKPSYLVGTAYIPDLGVNGHWDEGKFFIVEGDEYVKSKTDSSPKFFDLSPDTSIITSIEWEHVDVYKNVQALEEVFEKLIQKTQSKVVACRDWKSVQKIIERHKEKAVTYGYSVESEWQISDFSQTLHFSKFFVKRKNKIFDEFELNLMGRFNALNALACVITALHYDISPEIIKAALRSFSGLERRMNISHVKEVTCIDDYAHHPTEVYETLHAIRNTYSKRNIVCIFQPHTASRTEAFLEGFSHAFADADTVVLVDTFASAREQGGGTSIQELFSAIKKHHPSVHYFGGIHKTANELRKRMKQRDVIITMGAGDVYKIKRLLFEK